MKNHKSAAELARVHGAPAHKVQHGEIEIWHYPLGVSGGTLYSIHVAVLGDDASQVYMFMEPSSAPDTERKPRSWWRFWKR
jgi:hypothetical protein